MTNPLCDQCKSLGLPILLTRYAVVPSTVTQSLPGWASGDKVKSIALGGDYKYALRSLRAGYVYLFYGKGPRGSKYWECYTVGDDGSMILQPSTAMAQPQATPELLCKRDGHTNQNVYFIVIQEPHKCGPVWIAFSEHKWSEETLARYKADTALRDKRMQTIQPPAMAAGTKHTHGQIADAAVLKEIIEFAPREATLAALPHGGNAATVSSADGSYRARALAKHSTRTPWHFKDDVAQPLVERMIARGKTPDPNDKDAKPHVLALWDAVGITHELNGFRNEPAGRVAQYGQERELELSAMHAIEGVRKALEAKSGAAARSSAEGMVAKWTPEDSAERLKNAQQYFGNDPARMARERELTQRWEQDAINKAPDFLSRQRMYAMNFSQAEWQQQNDRIDAQIREINASVVPGTNQTVPQYRDSVAAQAERKAIAEAWPKYEKKLQAGAQQKFKAKYDAFLDAADKIIDARTVELIKWLEAPLFIDTLEDYNDQNIGDGVAFETVVSEALFALNSSKNGAAKLDAWIAQGKASTKENLVWRTVALNQKDAVAEVDAAVQAAKDHAGTPLTEAAISTALLNLKNMQRLADTYKKTQAHYNANTKASAVGGSKSFGITLKPASSYGLDSFAISVGDRIFKAFRIDKVGDFVADKIIQHMFSLRAFVQPADAINLIKAQARLEGITRAQTIRRIQATRGFMQLAPNDTDQAKQLRAAWSEFKSSHADGPANFKDARLAIVVGLIEGVNFAKLASQANGDLRSSAMITASALTIAAAIADVAAAPAKSLFELQDAAGKAVLPGAAAWSYQRLKLIGGTLGGTASFIGAIVDFVDAKKMLGRDKIALAVLYTLKGTVGLAGTALTLATTFTYAAPVLERITGRAAIGTAARVIGVRAAAVVGTRILLMSVGAWVTVGLIVVQVVIWVFADDALQDWCDESAFGENARFKTAKEQSEALDKALLEVL